MNEINYRIGGKVMIPEIELLEQDRMEAMGKYGIMRKMYLKENQPGMYYDLMMSGKLADHLEKIELAAQSRLETLIPQLAQKAGVTEKLKEQDMLTWVGLMNTCKAQAEEILLAELINN